METETIECGDRKKRRRRRRREKKVRERKKNGKRLATMASKGANVALQLTALNAQLSKKDVAGVLAFMKQENISLNER